MRRPNRNTFRTNASELPDKEAVEASRPKSPEVKLIDPPIEIDYHKVEGNEVNDQLLVHALDAKGQGGAHHRYRIMWPWGRHFLTQTFDFQNGPIQEFGVNGLTQEVLLAIVIHRLECFQEGEFANQYNAAALDHCTMALDSLKARTRDRLARGVEGKNKK